jgi:TolA-binding protein
VASAAGSITTARRRWPVFVALTFAIVIGAGLGAVVFMDRGGAGAVPPPPPARVEGSAVPAAPPAAPPAATAPTPPTPTPPEPAAPALALAAPDAGPAEVTGPRPETPVRPAKSAAALYTEGTELFVQGKHAKAKDRFKEAIALDPRHAAAHRGLGLVYQAMGRAESAIHEFERYLRRSPSAGDAGAIQARIAKLKETK